MNVLRNTLQKFVECFFVINFAENRHKKPIYN